ncbi:MAG: RNase adapter RapZ [Acidimicrobiia bacterium]|nr:RNase adapter RapZ [Acidimicrobiia bacterium]
MSESRAVIITGMSGAGRSQAAKVMEDLGYFVVDNLPTEMIKFLVDQIGVPEGRRERIAVVVDTRGGVTFDALDAALRSLLQRSIRTTVLFMDASDEALERRFEETRRSHPIAEGTLADRIATERDSFEEIRGLADVIIDTTELNVHELRDKVIEAFETSGHTRRLRVDVISFGFKRGTPRVVDVLFDVRFLPNPHWIPELRPLTGHDDPVRDHVLRSADAEEFVAKAMDLLQFLLPRYEAEGKAYLTIGIGCTGGKHRSVALADELTRLLREEGFDANVSHRDTPDADE